MKKILLLFFITHFVFSQSNTNLENKIYNELEAFVENSNANNLEKLEKIATTFHPKSQAEILAFFTLQYNLGYYKNQFGSAQKAIEYYENAWRLYQKNQLYKYEVIESCLKPLSELYIKIGEYNNAENIIKQYYYIASKNNNSSLKYAAILHLSIVYQSTGKVNQAIDLLEKTIKTETLTKNQKGNLYGNLGANYLIRIQSTNNQKNDYNNAEKALLTSIDLLKSDKTQLEYCSNAYRNLAQLNLNSNLKMAQFYFEKAAIEFQKIKNIEPRKKAKFYTEYAKLALQQNDFEKVNQELSLVFKTLIPNYKNGLPTKKSLYAETVLLDALEIQSQLYSNQNQPKKALQSYELCFHIESLFQSLLTYENSKIISQIRNRNRIEKCIEIYFNLYQKEKNKTYLEHAFLLSEETKSTVLKNHLSQLKTISSEEKLIQSQLQNWNNIILKEQQKGDFADIDKINEAIKKQNELMLLLKSKSSKNTTIDRNKLNCKTLYNKLQKDASVLVEYFSGNEKMYIFTIENQKIKLNYFWNNAENKAKILSFLEYFTNAENILNNPTAYNISGHRLYQLLKIPMKSSNQNLIIIPDGIVTFLPFESLITKESQTTNFAKMHYVLNDFIVDYNNSASFYLNTIPFKNSEETILGVFPIFENSNLELAFSKKELENLKRNFKGEFLEKKEATFTNFKTNALNYSILHLSTHASSGDVFEPASIRFFDEEVLYSEFYNLEINPDLVVLSACETGLGKLYKAEGAMSIARGFQFAGAQNLLFSLWKVNDFTTSYLMELFYKNIKNGKSYAEANHQSKLDFLSSETIPNSKKSPYYWSAFVYYGTLENKSTSNYFIWMSIIGGLIGLFLLFKFYKKWKISKQF